MNKSIQFIAGRFFHFLFVLGTLFFSSGCYSLKSTSIDPSITNFTVVTFEGRADNGPVTLPVTFTEKLKDKIRRESRLRLVDTDPDLTFSGAIEDFSVSSQAPTSDNVSALSRLTIRVHVDFENKHDETKNWNQTFTFFQEFDGTQNLLDVQDRLVLVITNQLTEDIFNKAFGDW
ncbi:MAG: LPS assembly lipoprotein LptE [Saprospiraceae bacterium]